MQTVNNDCISNGTVEVEEVLNPGGQVMVLLVETQGSGGCPV